MKKSRAVNKKHKTGKEIGRLKSIAVFVFLCSTLSVLSCSLMTNSGTDATLRNTLFAAGFGLVLGYLWFSAVITKRVDYDNALHPYRFFSVFLICLVFSLFLPRMSALAWPAVVLYVWPTFVSDRVTGFFAGTGFLFIACLLSPENTQALFIAYTATGACAVISFSEIDRDFSKLRAVGITVLVQCFASCACVFLFRYQPLTFEQFVLPIVSIALSSFLLVILTYWFSSVYLKWDRDRYMDINDPEFSLMTAIRSKSKEEYFRAVHCAYLTEKAAGALALKKQAAKTLAYYKRIGCLDDEGDSVWEETEHYFSDFEFPEDAVLLLKEYMIPDSGQSKEGTVVLLCDELVVSLTDIFKKNKDAHVNYDDIIDKLFTTALEKGKLKNSDLSIRELEDFRALLKQEKLYYDFLR